MSFKILIVLVSEGEGLMNHTAAYHQGHPDVLRGSYVVIFMCSLFAVAAGFKMSFHTLLDSLSFAFRVSSSSSELDILRVILSILANFSNGELVDSWCSHRV